MQEAPYGTEAVCASLYVRRSGDVALNPELTSAVEKILDGVTMFVSFGYCRDSRDG